jgi:protocatechuate 4,5-dioxygenase, beta chain
MAARRRNPPRARARSIGGRGASNDQRIGGVGAAWRKAGAPPQGGSCTCVRPAAFLNAYPTFALGVADVYPVADEGFGSRPFPPLPGDARLGWHIARSLVADEFDITICQELEVDHGVISPLPMVDFSEGEGGWKIPIVPLAVNVILHPLPSPLRCWKLGQALRRAVLSYAEDISVVVVGTGGLSHQLTGPRFGQVAPDWDKEFMRLLAREPERLTELT